MGLFNPLPYPLLQALVDTSGSLIAVIENTGADGWGIDWVQAYVGQEIFLCPVGDNLKIFAKRLNSWAYYCKAKGKFLPILLNLWTKMYF